MTRIRIQREGVFVVLRFAAIPGLTDIDLSVAASDNLSRWDNVTEQFSRSVEWRPGEAGGVDYVYRSLQPVGAHRIFRIQVRPAVALTMQM